MNLSTYKALLKVYFIQTFERPFERKKNTMPTREHKNAKGIAVIVGMAILLLFVLFSFIMTVYGYTLIAVEGGYEREFLYCLVGLGQLIILFLGGTTTITNLYFANDNELLFSLPLSSYAIFSAKMTSSYGAQLLFSFLTVPFLITYGIAVQSCGIALSAWFYILSVLSFLLIPAVPMFLFTVLSAPLLFLSTFFKKKENIKNIVTLCGSLIFIVVYFIFFIGMDESNSPEDTRIMIEKAGKIFIYNYSLCESLLSNGAAGNFFLYLAETTVLLAISVLFCGFLYKKTIPKFSETSSVGTVKTKKKTVEAYAVKSVKKSMFAKDLQLLFGNPALLVSCLVSVLMIGVFSVISGKIFNGISDDPYGLGLLRLGFVSYLIYVMLTSSASSTAFLFSLEKNNIETIKSLPIAGKEVVISKWKVSAVFPVITVVIFFICFSISADSPFEIAFAFFTAVAFAVFGVGINAVMLKKDMQTPNFTYNSVNELTKNNKKMLKPMLAVMPIGFAILISDVIFSMAGGTAIWIGYTVHVAVLAVSAGLFLGIGGKKLINEAETLYENTEV